MKNLKAYFVPHPPLAVSEVGRGDEKKITKTLQSYHQVAKEISEFKPDTIIFISPHATTYRDYFHIEKTKICRGNFAQFRAPEIKFSLENDLDFVNQLLKEINTLKFPAGTEGMQDNSLDHGITVPLYFIKKYLQDFKIVCLSFSMFDKATHFKYGQIIKGVIKKQNHKRFVVISSGDLSHVLKEDGPYGFQKEGPEFDKQICNILNTGNFQKLFEIDKHLISRASECGYRSILILSGILDGLIFEPKLLSYEGTFGVGYAVASFHIKGEKE